MKRSAETVVTLGVAVGFLALAGALFSGVWGRQETVAVLPTVDPKFTNTAPVRVSAAELIRTGGDASGLDCYACHERGKPPTLHLNAEGGVVLPKEHDDLVIRHGRNDRNNQCFNCHDPEHLDQLRGRNGTHFTWQESSKLCGSCHGPTYRDWETGIHGRTSGFWDRGAGAIARLECASCHHPHSPAFPTLNPAPAPHPLHAKETRAH